MDDIPSVCPQCKRKLMRPDSCVVCGEPCKHWCPHCKAFFGSHHCDEDKLKAIEARRKGGDERTWGRTENEPPLGQRLYEGLRENTRDERGP